ncbi:MAG: DUF4037 domain-containing protein [Syntrophobacteraceae bacterium]
MIKTMFAPFEDRIAVGLVGEGSECFGFDDEISRDHDWGPGFCLWLDSDDYNDIGSALEAEYRSLPQSFQNFERISTRWGTSRLGVKEIGAFYRSFIGTTHAPDDIEQWFFIPEPNLAACTNGKVFHDPLGKFSAIRSDLLAYFPEDVRLAKIVARCAAAAQSGQYNYPRTVKRDEPFAALFSLTKFCDEIISLGFLLNRRYCPFYKWSHRAVLALPVMGDFLYSQIRLLCTEPDTAKKIDLIENISSAVINELQAQNLSSGAGDFLLNHAVAVIKNISDPKIAKRARAMV